MQSAVSFRFHRGLALLLVLGGGTLAYMLMPSCANLVDADDALCHAIASPKDGAVDWPDDAHWYFDSAGACHIFDHVMASPWWSNSEARAYIEGFGIAQGHNWDSLGRDDMMTFNTKTYEVDTPLARTYNGYANIVYANLEGIELDRSRSLGDFEYYDTFLKWSSAYVSQKTYRINGNCKRDCRTVESNRCVIARTVSGRLRNDYIDLYQTFFYEIDAIWRASTIVHEVRHARDEVLHNGGSGCPDGSACDYSWSHAGSNTYEALWLAALYYAPAGHPFVSDARRDRAKSLFYQELVTGFTKPPIWSLDKMENINETPEFYVEQVACSDDPRHPHHCLVLAN